MNKLFVSLVAALAASSVVMAQGQGGGRGQGGNQQGRGAQAIQVPISVLRESLPLTKEKLDALEADIKLFMSVQLPTEAVLELKLTADQKKTLTEVANQTQQKVRELMQSGDREGAMTLRQSVVSKVSAVLTEEQKKVVEKYPSRQGGGAGRRGPGGTPAI